MSTDADELLLSSLDELEGQLWADLLAAEQAYQDTRSPHIGPSDVRALHKGGCRKQLAYRVQEYDPSDPEPVWLRRQAVMGTAIHAHIAEARKAAHPGWKVEHPVLVPGFSRTGTVDAYGDGTADDVKSKSDRGYQAVVNRGLAYPADRDQVLLYGLGLEDQGDPVLRCSVTYVNRSDGESFVDSWTYDRAEAVAVADKMHALMDLVELVPAEQVERGGRGPDWRPCDSCPYRTMCWQLEDVPEGYTALSAELAPEEVADAAEQLRLVRQQQTELKEAADYLAAQLQGHGGQLFTDSDGIERRVAFSKGKPPGEGGQLDSKAVRAHYALLGEEPPTLGVSPRLTLPKHTTRRTK